MASYLVQRDGIYYFRRAVPFELLPYFPVKQIWTSLRTRNKRLAKTSVLRLAGSFEALTLRIRSGVMTKDEIRAAVRQYLQSELNTMERIQNNPLSPQDAGYRHSQQLELLKDSIHEYKRLLALRTHDAHEITCAVDRLIDRFGLQLAYGSDDYNSLCREYLKGQIELFERWLRETNGDFSDSEPLLKFSDTHPTTGTSQPEVVTNKQPSFLLSNAIDKFIAQKETEGGLDDVTMKEYAQAYRLLPEIIGNKPVSDVSRDDVRLVLETLKLLPKNMNKNRETRGKPLSEIVEIAKKENLPKLGPAAIEKKFQRIKSFLTWAFHEGLIEREICADITFKRSKVDTRRPDEEQPAYTLTDLQGLVKGMLEERRKGVFEKNPERYWIPLIALFSGCRLEEICQLHVEDVAEVDEIWCFLIVPELDENGEKKKRIKRASSKRIIPIHPTLMELGFIDFFEQEIVAKRQPRLWPALKKGSNGKFQRNIKDWYNGTDNRKGFENLYIDNAKDKSFHSTRHTFTTALKYLLVDDRLMTELLGQSHQTLTAGRYGKPFPPSQLLDALKKIDYKVDFVGQLGRWPYHPLPK